MQRRVKLFLPENIPDTDTLNEPSEPTAEDAAGAIWARSFDEAGYRKLEGEVLYYLGDNVVWKDISQLV